MTGARGLSKRALAVTLAAAMAAVTITACGSGSGDDGPRTLKLWHYEGPDSAMGWRGPRRSSSSSRPIPV